MILSIPFLAIKKKKKKKKKEYSGLISLVLVRKPGKEKGNSELKQPLLHLKIDIMSYSAHGWRIG